MSNYNFTEEEIFRIREKWLNWYDCNKRSLLWRDNADVDDDTQRAYQIWVSEVMLQQTRVSVVIDYYHRYTYLFQISIVIFKTGKSIYFTNILDKTSVHTLLICTEISTLPPRYTTSVDTTAAGHYRHGHYCC